MAGCESARLEHSGGEAVTASGGDGAMEAKPSHSASVAACGVGKTIGGGVAAAAGCESARLKHSGGEGDDG